MIHPTQSEERDKTSTSETLQDRAKPLIQDRPLTAAARRALEEAALRHGQNQEPERPNEIGGRAGLDPVRYGDWEIKGLASDF